LIFGVARRFSVFSGNINAEACQTRIQEPASQNAETGSQIRSLRGGWVLNQLIFEEN
jgi:hypothetical protein